MKDLKNLQNELLSMHSDSKILSSKEKQDIKGGQYYSLEECEAECQSGQSGFGWSWGGSPGGCYLVFDDPEIWDCRDS